MKKLVVLHDISSYNDFQVLEHLQSMLNDVDVIPVEITYPYKYVMRNLNKFCYEVKPDAIIGLSAGAMFVQQMHGYRKILINPLLHVSWGCATIESVQFGGITNFDKEHTYVFFADKDSQNNAYNEYVKAYKNIMTYPIDSGMQGLLDTHVRPLARKLLNEEFDKNNIDAVGTNELLAEISEGGRKGRAALYRLEEVMADVLADVTTCYYNSFYDGRETAWEGFRKVTREFVFDIENMSYGNYTKFLYEHLHSYIEEKIIENNFLIAANAGKDMNPVDAMRELAYLYTHSIEGTCENTVAYEAGAEWLERYKKDKQNHNELSWQLNFFEAIPFLVDDERPQLVILDMEKEEKMKTAVESADFTTPETLKALCWGINQKLSEEMCHPFFMIIKVIIDDDNSIDTSERGIFFSQHEAEEALQDWSTNKHDYLLCYIMHIVPRREQFSDDFVKVSHYVEGEHLVDDMKCKEFVYMPTGFSRKYNFRIDDQVKYIYYDGKETVLRKSCIVRLPTSEDDGICMSDGFQVPERYVFPIEEESNKNNEMKI
jgi:hypothetical protein